MDGTFRNVTACSASLANPLQFSGREFETETHLYYYRARYYDCDIGGVP
jgi:RHS repeat-associated protein